MTLYISGAIYNAAQTFLMVGILLTLLYIAHIASNMKGE